MKKVPFLNKNGPNMTIAAVVNFPAGFEESKKYPAVVVAHPGGSVKQQTASLYARKLVENHARWRTESEPWASARAEIIQLTQRSTPVESKRWNRERSKYRLPGQSFKRNAGALLLAVS
jgi:dipeptidyl aminopeptidase/acylaminoacyl peptidase